MLDSHSCVAKAFRMARDWCNTNNSYELKLRLIGERQQSRRQFNRPQVPEIAALILGDFGSHSGKRYIVIHNKKNGLQRISKLHPLYMVMQYPLLFPYGEDGYHEIKSHIRTIKKRGKQRGLM